MLLERHREATQDGEESTTQHVEHHKVSLLVEGGSAEQRGVALHSLLLKINGTDIDNLSFDAVLAMLKNAPRPLTLTLERIEPVAGTTSAAELAAEEQVQDDYVLVRNLFDVATGGAEMMTFAQALEHTDVDTWLKEGSLRVQDVRDAWEQRVGAPDTVSADFETFLILLDDLEEYPEPPDDDELDRAASPLNGQNPNRSLPSPPPALSSNNGGPNEARPAPPVYRSSVERTSEEEGERWAAAEGEEAALSSALRKVSAAGLSLAQSPKVKRAVATDGHARSTLLSHHHHKDVGSSVAASAVATATKGGAQ